MEQLSFLHQLVKMLLNGSKWNFSSVYLRNKKKIILFSLTGRRLPFGLAHRASPTCPAPRPIACARALTGVRPRPPRGGHAPASSPRSTTGLPRPDHPHAAFKAQPPHPGAALAPPFRSLLHQRKQQSQQHSLCRAPSLT